jgi:hypothetical protein
LMARLRRFTASDVPAVGRADIPVDPRGWNQSVPPVLPGMAQPPMLDLPCQRIFGYSEASKDR